MTLRVAHQPAGSDHRFIYVASLARKFFGQAKYHANALRRSAYSSAESDSLASVTEKSVIPSIARGSRGFTLVEVIVALAVLSLIMLATVSGFRTLGNTARVLDARIDKTDELRSVASFLRDALENSVVGSESGGEESLTLGGFQEQTSVSYFSVKDNAVVWRSKLMFGENFGGSYFLRLAKQGEQLVLQWQAPQGRTAPETWNKSPSRTVLRKVEEFSVAYRMQAGGEWIEREPIDTAPALVRLTVKANGKYWPEMIMRVQR